jgi:hypothetical protein
MSSHSVPNTRISSKLFFWVRLCKFPWQLVFISNLRVDGTSLRLLSDGSLPPRHYAPNTVASTADPRRSGASGAAFSHRVPIQISAFPLELSGMEDIGSHQSNQSGIVTLVAFTGCRPIGHVFHRHKHCHLHVDRRVMGGNSSLKTSFHWWICVMFLSQSLSFTKLQPQQSVCVKSGDPAGRLIGPRRSIYLFENIRSTS